jgi:excisionase family DNA binding protein
MPPLSLREAAEQAGVSKSTIFRAVQRGRLSAPRDHDGNFAIDPAELFRVYPPPGERPLPSLVPRNTGGQSAPSAEAVELRIRHAQLDAELRAIRSLLEAEKERASEFKAERDRWRAQAERLVLAPPVERPVSTPRIRASGWFGWRRAS